MPASADHHEEPSLAELMYQVNVGPSELAREMSVTPMAVFYAQRRQTSPATRLRYVAGLERCWARHREAVEELVAEGSRLLADGAALTALVGLGASE